MKNLLLILLFIANHVHAANWVYVASQANAEGQSLVFELDTQSVMKRDGLIQAWSRFTTTPALQAPNSYPAKMYQSYVSLDHYDCNLREAASSQRVFYSEIFGAGESVFEISRQRGEIKNSMQSVVPGSYGESLLTKVCELSKQKFREPQRP